MTYNKKKAAVFELAFDDELQEVQKLVGIADDSGRVQRNCGATHASQYLCACLADPFINGPRSATTNVEVSRSSVAEARECRRGQGLADWQRGWGPRGGVYPFRPAGRRQEGLRPEGRGLSFPACGRPSPARKAARGVRARKAAIGVRACLLCLLTCLPASSCAAAR